MIDVLEVVDRNRLGRFSIAYWYKFKSCHLYFIIFFPGWLTKYACPPGYYVVRSKVCWLLRSKKQGGEGGPYFLLRSSPEVWPSNNNIVGASGASGASSYYFKDNIAQQVERLYVAQQVLCSNQSIVPLLFLV